MGINFHEFFFNIHSTTFGELIRKRRLTLKKPIREVAGQIELDQSLLSKIERNKMIAPARIIQPLAGVLELNYEELQTHYWSERIFHEIKEEAFAEEALEIALKRLKRYVQGNKARAPSR